MVYGRLRHASCEEKQAEEGMLLVRCWACELCGAGDVSCAVLGMLLGRCFSCELCGAGHVSCFSCERMLLVRYATDSVMLVIG